MKKGIAFMLITLSWSIAFTQNVGIGTNSPKARLHVIDSSVVLSGPSILPISPGNTPISGGGTRMMWYADKAAFRVGGVTGNNWDKDSIGYYSFAAGTNTQARGGASTSFGDYTIASGNSSTSMGYATTASGNSSTSMGYYTIASGINSTSMGRETNASGFNSTSMGYGTHANGEASTAMGYTTIANGNHSTSMGDQTNAVGNYSTSMGYGTHANGEASTTMGYGTIASGGYSTAMGYYTTASDHYATSMGRETTASGLYSTSMGMFTTASGWYSTSMGYQSTATSNYSTSMGWRTTASGSGSVSAGYEAIASGNYSTSMGFSTKAKAYGSFTTGMSNDDTDNPGLGDPGATDRIFQIGNGGFTSKSNAITVLRNGNTGIGTVTPSVPLSFANTFGTKISLYHGSYGDVGIGIYGGELRLQNDIPNGKVSMGVIETTGTFTELAKAERNGGYAFSIFGSLWVNGTTYASDERFKQNITAIPSPIQKLLQINGVEYEMKINEFAKNHFQSGRQIGLIAQNVEKIIPEAVNEMDGYKGVDYAKLVPLLIEGIKEQQKQIETSNEDVKQLKQQVAELKKLVEQLLKK